MPCRPVRDTRDAEGVLTPERLERVVRALVDAEASYGRSVPVGVVVRRLLEGRTFASHPERNVAYEALREEVRRLSKRVPGLRYVETPVP